MLKLISELKISKFNKMYKTALPWTSLSWFLWRNDYFLENMATGGIELQSIWGGGKASELQLFAIKQLTVSK